MGAVYQSTCYAGATQAAAAMCGGLYPQTRTDPATGAITSLSCTFAADGSSITVHEGAVSNDPDAGCTTWHVTSPQAGDIGSKDFGAPGGVCSAAAADAVANSGNQTSCSVGADGRSFTEVVVIGGTSYTFNGVRNCPAAAEAAVVPVSFSACNASETYEDIAAVWLLGAAALAAVWGIKTFVYKLVTNQ